MCDITIIVMLNLPYYAEKKEAFGSLVLMTLGVKLPVVLAVFQITFKVGESTKNFGGDNRCGSLKSS